MTDLDRDQILAIAAEIHDRGGCRCDRRYLMSCGNMAAAILRVPAEIAKRSASPTRTEARGS